MGNDKPSESHAIRLPGNKPAARRIAAVMLVVPLLVNTVSFVFTVRMISPLFLLVAPFWFSQNPFSPHLAGEVNLSSQGYSNRMARGMVPCVSG